MQATRLLHLFYIYITFYSVSGTFTTVGDVHMTICVDVCVLYVL